MSFRLSSLIVASLLWASPALAAPVVFFGEDVNTAGDPAQPPLTQSNAARDTFFAHLTGAATESFESFPTGEEAVLEIAFSGAGTATVLGGMVTDGENIAGRYPASGLKYLDAESPIRMTFSSPIAAFGFYATDVGDFGGQLSLQLTALSGEVINFVVPASTGIDGSTTGSILYFGFYDLANTYSSVFFDNGDYSDIIGIDDFTIAGPGALGPSPIPEPAVWSLMIVGFGLIGSVLRSRERSPHRI